MPKSLLRLVSAILIAVFLCIFDFSLQPSKVEAQVFKDPLLEYSYHAKIDLTWLKQFAGKIFDTTGMNPRQAAKIKEILDILDKTGIVEMENITMDFRMEKDRFTGSTKIMITPNAQRADLLHEVIAIPPRASVVRAMIPEDQTLAWISVMDPMPVYNMLDEYIIQPIQAKKGNPFKECPFKDLFAKFEGYIGDEAHLVFFNLGGFDEANPKPYAALIIQMADGIKDEDIKIIKDTFTGLFVDKLGGKMETGNWKERFEVLSFKDFGCPLDINPSLIVDKNYLIFATHPETLYEAAGYVLTPARTAQGMMPVVMNAMISVNIDKLVNILPPDAWQALIEMGIGSDMSNITSAVKEEDWGSVQLMRTHIPDGVLIECSMDRSLFSLLFNIWQTVISSEIHRSILSADNPEPTVRSNAHTLHIALERYAVDKEGKYPETFKELIDQDYMRSFPVNPYTDKPMNDVIFDKRAPGEFTYIPIKNPETKVIEDFYLLCYGETENSYDRLNNQALIKNSLVEDNPDGVPDDVLIIINGKSGEMD